MANEKPDTGKPDKGEKQPTMVVPEGHQPEEFYNDEQLVVYHQQQHDALADDHPGKGKAKKDLSRAKIAAAITAAVDPDAEAD